MKYVSELILVIVCFFSCKKQDSANITKNDSGCIQQVFANKNQLLANADYIIATTLFTSNAISYNNLQFYNIVYDSVLLAGTVYQYQHIKSNEFVNGLAVFYGEAIYHFKNNNYQTLSGIRYNTTDSNIDTISSLRLSQIRKLWVDAINKYQPNLSTYKDSCLIAQFGYLDTTKSSSSTIRKLVKAWHVRTVNKQYPDAFFYDDGSFCSLFDGVCTFK